MRDNEVYLKRVLRMFRNGIVQCVRERLRAKLAGSAELQLSTLFGKKEAGSDVTQWERMKINAGRARASPEVSTIVADDFELLGVSDFHSVFEKFFADLRSPAPAGEAPEVLSDRKKGLLRCLQQIKVFRDPNAHDVSEAIDTDSLTLCILNCKKVCKELDLPMTHQALAELHKELLEAVETKHAMVVRISDEVEVFDLSQRCLSLSGASFVSSHFRDLALNGRLASAMCDIQNCIIVVGGAKVGELIEDEIAALNEMLTTCDRNGQLPVILISNRLEESAISALLAPAALQIFKRSERLPLVPAYVEAAASRLNRLLKSGMVRRARPPAVLSVPVAQAVHDDKLAPMIFKMIRDPHLKVVRIVAPFATDLRFGVFGQISDAMIDAKKRGCKVSFVTRPPASTDQDMKAKKVLLQRLHSEDIELFLNSRLHSKIYLFEREGERNFWAVGSHNMTNYAHNGKSLETSMVGYRAQEFEEAQTSFERARRQTDTLKFDLWASQQMRTNSHSP